MKTSTMLKAALAVSIGLFTAGKGTAQTTFKGFDGWTVSVHTGASAGKYSMHWGGPVVVSQVTNLALPGGPITVVPATLCSMRDTSTRVMGVSMVFQVGYSRMFNHVLAGAEFGINTNPGSISQTTVFYPETMLQARNTLSFTREIRLGMSKSLTVRTGYVKGRHLVYATAGIAVTPVKMTANDDYKLAPQDRRAMGNTATANGFTYTSVINEQHATKTMLGISLGAGYQYSVSDNVRVGIEYRSTSYGHADFTVDAVKGEQPIGAAGNKTGIGGAIGANSVSASLKQQSVMVRVDISFSAISALWKH
jgi:opacity protein-like surface antigen